MNGTMKKVLARFSAALVIACGSTGVAQAIPVEVSVTADNVFLAAVCPDDTCIGGTLLAPLVNADDWRLSDTVVLDLGPGTHWFGFGVLNEGENASGNPAGLLAEILWGTNANYSSEAWEVFIPFLGISLGNATEYGSNGGPNIWTSVNGGAPVSGISTNANWIYTDDNFADADRFAFFRTSITVVPEPTTLSLLGISLLGFGLLRRRKRI